jgi:hypothetical protein
VPSKARYSIINVFLMVLLEWLEVERRACYAPTSHHAGSMPPDA